MPAKKKTTKAVKKAVKKTRPARPTARSVAGTTTIREAVITGQGSRRTNVEDCLVTVLRRKNAIGRTKVLSGYLAQPEDDEKYLLYTSPALDDAVVFAQSAVIHMVRFVTSGEPASDVGGRMVWLEKDARVAYVGPRPRSEHEEFLRGLFATTAEPTNLILGGRTVMRVTGTHGVGCW